MTAAALRHDDAREMIALVRTSLDSVYASFHRGEIDLDTLVAEQDRLHAEIRTIRGRAGWTA